MGGGRVLDHGRTVSAFDTVRHYTVIYIGPRLKLEWSRLLLLAFTCSDVLVSEWPNGLKDCALSQIDWDLLYSTCIL